MTRRQFTKILLGATAAYVTGRTIYFAGWERYDLHISQWRVPLPRLPADLEGLRLSLISDLHLSPGLSRNYVLSTLQVVSQLGAEAILLAGDVLSAVPSHLEQYRRAFTDVQAPAGKYAVLGNHDFLYHRSEPIVEFLNETGWQVLRNESLPLPATHERVWLVGVDDPVTSHDDLEKALADAPKQSVHVLLSHTPDLIEPAATAGVDLMLAGHTHGGQVVAPFLGPLVVPSQYGAKYAWGLFDYQGTRMVVTRGVGMVTPHIRFNCPPEIALLTLHRGDRELSAGGPERDFRPQIRRARSVVRRLRRRLRPSG